MFHNLSLALKKLLSSELKSLVEAEFLDNELRLTDRGNRELLFLVSEDYRAKLAVRAEEVIKEREERVKRESHC